MDFAFTDEQEELRESARAFLEEFSGSEQVRRAAESDLGYDPENVLSARIDMPDHAIAESERTAIVEQTVETCVKSRD